MAENEKNQVIRYGILALESLERKLTSDEEKEMGEIRESLKLTHEEILEKAKIEILS